MKLNKRNPESKALAKELSVQIKSMEEEMRGRHLEELRQFDGGRDDADEEEYDGRKPASDPVMRAFAAAMRDDEWNAMDYDITTRDRKRGRKSTRGSKQQQQDDVEMVARAQPPPKPTAAAFAQHFSRR